MTQHDERVVVDGREREPREGVPLMANRPGVPIRLQRPDGVSWSCSNCATIFTRIP